jgi:hypothetical protein
VWVLGFFCSASLRSLTSCHVCEVAPSFVSGWRAFSSVALCNPIPVRMRLHRPTELPRPPPHVHLPRPATDKGVTPRVCENNLALYRCSCWHSYDRRGCPPLSRRHSPSPNSPFCCACAQHLSWWPRTRPDAPALAPLDPPPIPLGSAEAPALLSLLAFDALQTPFAPGPEGTSSSFSSAARSK